jgi:putative membrane protein
VLFFLGKIVKDIGKNAWQALAPLAVVLATRGDIIEKIKIVGIAAGVLILGGSVLRYLYFRFRLEDDSILIREGVLKKKQTDIKFDRIQGINTHRNFIFRFFGLVTVRFDTAGSSDDEGHLPAVSRKFADSLREKLTRTPGHAPKEEADSDIAAAAAPLLRLDWRDMIRIGLADKRVFLVLALIGPVLEQLGDKTEEVIGPYVESAFAGAMQFGIAAGVGIVAGAIVVFFGLLVLLAIGAAFLRYHEFELFLDGHTLRSCGGLLTQHEVSMGLDKIQTLRLQQGIILRWLKRFRMTARQARSSQKNDASKNFTVPVVTGSEAAGLRRQMMNTEGRGLILDPASPEFIPISKHSMRVPFIVFFWMPLVWPFIYSEWRHSGFLYTDEGLVRRSGVVGYRTVALLYRKVQRVTVRQSPLQRRKGLATLRVHMASGSVKFPYIDHALAKQLRDYMLYRVESSTRKWH